MRIPSHTCCYNVPGQGEVLVVLMGPRTYVDEGMYRLLGIILLLSFSLISCKGGTIKEGMCPDGEPMFVPTKLEEAFPAYVQENQLVISQTDELLTKTQPLESVEERVVKLRQDLEQERIELETRLKVVLVSLQMTPCGKPVRDSAWKLLGDLNTKTAEIPDRVKQLNSN